LEENGYLGLAVRIKFSGGFMRAKRGGFTVIEYSIIAAGVLFAIGAVYVGLR
jgi:hypothetical protein